VPDEHIVPNRTQALRGALALLDGTSENTKAPMAPSSIS
jgi:hypothetical protein